MCQIVIKLLMVNDTVADAGDHGDDAARRGAHGGPAGHREGGGTAHAGLRLRRRRPRLSRRSNYGEMVFYLPLTDLIKGKG